MAKAKKKIKVRDMKPKKDAKGGMSARLLSSASASRQSNLSSASSSASKLSSPNVASY